ncbi:MAG: ShlB/FhaC/HecB family hemolysin secretion/activation protein [Sphingomonadaceae bacterium]|nr:ShlB/FhaC/HecB family hemolysin secretion/activation protein [Sphingomonadaceae bacterium]MCP5391497.1 ShlB/FhaC/HecB family hemolysin secretion/activation protein [Sphingomonadaceae bacterium]MCP5394434.1 ShlB/FhaC/HecB family hemolysin secretion/activation protein [Sphingomonadaceae bacterium]
MIRFAQTEQRKSPIASSRFPTFALLAGTLLATFWAAGPAAAQTAPVPTTREEIQRERLEDRLQTQGEAVAVEEGAVERAPCPLADPQFADIRFTFTGANFTGLDAIGTDIVAPAYADLIGQELPVAAICGIRDRAGTILRQQGYLAAVQVPAQSVDGGVVRFDAVLARMSAVQVRGEAGPSGKALQRYIDRLTNQPVFNIDEAERYLLLARDIPGLDVRLVLQPAAREDGAQPGDVVGVFNVTRTPFYSDANIQNYGSKSVGRFGGLMRMRFNGITGMGDETILSAYATADTSEQVVLQASHEFRVGGDGLKFGAGFTRAWSQPDFAGPDPFESDTTITSVYASYPFKRSQAANLYGAVGLDVIDQQTDFSGTPLSEDQLRVAYARLDFNSIDEASLRGANGYSGLEPRFGLAGSLEVRQGLDILGASDDCGPASSGYVACAVPGFVPISRLDGDPTGLSIRGEARVDFRPTPLWKLSVAPRFQYSPDALLGFEQVSGGNYTAGRGFDPGAVIGDSGYGGQVEVAYGSLLPETPGGNAFQPYAFFDLMAVSTKNVPGDPQTISSVGGGLRANIGQRLYLDIFGAAPLERAPFQAERGDFRVLVNLTIQLAPWFR